MRLRNAGRTINFAALLTDTKFCKQNLEVNSPHRGPPQKVGKSRGNASSASANETAKHNVCKGAMKNGLMRLLGVGESRGDLSSLSSVKVALFILHWSFTGTAFRCVSLADTGRGISSGFSYFLRGLPVVTRYKAYSLVLIRHWVSADNKEDRIAWIQTLNRQLSDSKAWSSKKAKSSASSKDVYMHAQSSPSKHRGAVPV